MNRDNKVIVFSIIMILVLSLIAANENLKPKYTPMALSPWLNDTLKKMWGIQEKFENQIVVTDEEKTFYNNNLKTIQAYYRQNAEKWNDQLPYCMPKKEEQLAKQ